jgi:hypothetical protein
VLSRYMVPMLPVLAWLGWRTAERWWVGEGEAAHDPPRVRRAILLGTLVAALVLSQNLAVYRAAVLPQVRSFSGGLRTSLVDWGKWLDRTAPPDALIATPDIGAIGYYSRRRVLDIGGLVTPRMVPLLEREPEESAVARLAFSHFARPDYLIDRAESADDLLRRSPYAARLTPLRHAVVPNLGIARPGPVTYTLYRVDWAGFDTTRTLP